MQKLYFFPHVNLPGAYTSTIMHMFNKPFSYLHFISTFLNAVTKYILLVHLRKL